MSNNSKQNYKTPPPPADIQAELEGIASKVRAEVGLACEIKGWWIWISGFPQISKPQAITLSNFGFFQAKKGRNVGNFYYKHPLAPNTRYARRHSHSAQDDQPAKDAQDSKPTDKPLTERQKLETHLIKLHSLLQTDSGENHININKLIAETKVELTELDIKEGKSTDETLPLQEFVDENKQKQAEKPKTSKPEEVILDDEEVDDILSSLFE